MMNCLRKIDKCVILLLLCKNIKKKLKTFKVVAFKLPTAFQKVVFQPLYG